MSKEKILSKYKDKTLAVESFGDNRKKFVSDFANIDGVLYELQQLNTHELSLTDDGLRFLDEYYGLDKVADMILQRIKEGIDYKYKNREDLVIWLKNRGE